MMRELHDREEQLLVENHKEHMSLVELHECMLF